MGWFVEVVPSPQGGSIISIATFTNSLSLLLHYGDLTDGQALTNLVLDVQPDEIYNLGAQSHVRVSFDQPVYTLMSDGVGCAECVGSCQAAQ